MAVVWIDSRLLLLEELLIPESALDSRLFLIDASILPLVSVCCRPHGRLLARSARVSLLYKGALFLLAPPPDHSLKISVSWAKELLRLRVLGGLVS